MRYLISSALFFLLLSGCKPVSDDPLSNPTPSETERTAIRSAEKVVISEAVRTILYLPLYHAKAKGYFASRGIDVEIVTAGTATASYTAMLNGSADFSQADPMYVPISMEKGAKTKIIAQVVGRIAVWGLTMDKSVKTLNIESLRGKKISTHPRPMTAYTYTIKAITDAGLIPDMDVIIDQIKPPNEITPLLKGQSDIAFTLEPNTSIAESRGAKVVKSFPLELGDQIFTALMTTDEFIQAHPLIVEAVAAAYQQALNDLHANPAGGIASAKKFFTGLDDNIIKNAIERMVKENVIPTSIKPSENSWNKAIAVRIKSGDLKTQILLKEAFYNTNNK